MPKQQIICEICKKIIILPIEKKLSVSNPLFTRVCIWADPTVIRYIRYLSPKLD
jgi:hypothetical protein